MRYKAVFFDLDGTLLPMDNEVFTKGYFKELAKKLSPLGLAPDALIAAVWAGTKAMVKNDGARQNVELFWETFAQVTAKDVTSFRAQSDDFYVNEFHNARAYTSENPRAAEAIGAAHAAAEIVVLASNPLFPLTGQCSRLSWVGLEKSDFDYITAYESECFCKPNPAYYTALCEKLGVRPAECLMVGNDEREDMYAATLAGLDGFYVTDCAIPCEEHPWNGKHGSFAELIAFLKTL